MWDDSAVTRDDTSRRDLEAALDEVVKQLRVMPRNEIVYQEDLAWSFESGVEVEVEVQSEEPLLLRLEASKGFLFRASADRTIEIEPK